MTKTTRDRPPTGAPAIVSTRRSQHLITQAADAMEAAEAKLHQRVHEARANGVTWEEIAAALGVTKQAAHRRFTSRQNGEGSE